MIHGHFEEVKGEELSGVGDVKAGCGSGGAQDEGPRRAGRTEAAM